MVVRTVVSRLDMVVHKLMVCRNAPKQRSTYYYGSGGGTHIGCMLVAWSFLLSTTGTQLASFSARWQGDDCMLAARGAWCVVLSVLLSAADLSCTRWSPVQQTCSADIDSMSHLTCFPHLGSNRKCSRCNSSDHFAAVNVRALLTKGLQYIIDAHA
jgi:hypothetical protein